mmetsp:Transcript_94349/g.215870  ORF Transcript_94349/g.215870 Transcript_94349/m.215870 type:complete len:348 (+) Transcript_94349:661-1704(+)
MASKKSSSIRVLNLGWNGIGDVEMELLTKIQKLPRSKQSPQGSPDARGASRSPRGSAGIPLSDEARKANPSRAAGFQQSTTDAEDAEDAQEEIGSIKDSDGMQRLANALKANGSLKDIDLSGNGIGVGGAIVLSEVIGADDAVVEKLVLAHNEFGEQGADYFCRGLHSCKSITHINLFNNSLRAEGSRHICDAITKESSITVLDLGYNCLEDEGAKHVALAITRGRLQKVSLAGNNIGDTGAIALFEAIKERIPTTTTAQLVDVDLWNNRIGNEGVSKLLEQSPMQAGWSRADLSGNIMSEDMKLKLESIFSAEQLILEGMVPRPPVEKENAQPASLWCRQPRESAE